MPAPPESHGKDGKIEKDLEKLNYESIFKK